MPTNTASAAVRIKRIMQRLLDTTDEQVPSAIIEPHDRAIDDGGAYGDPVIKRPDFVQAVYDEMAAQGLRPIDDPFPDWDV